MYWINLMIVNVLREHLGQLNRQGIFADLTVKGLLVTAHPADLDPINSDDCSDSSCKHSFPVSGVLYLNSWIW